MRDSHPWHLKNKFNVFLVAARVATEFCVVLQAGGAEDVSMNGQWIGLYAGTNAGFVVADLDDAGTSYVGEIFVYDDNAGAPRILSRLDLPKGQSRLSFRGDAIHMERNSGEFLSQGDLAQRFPGVHPSYSDAEWDIGPHQIAFKWTTDIGTHRAGQMQKSFGHTPSLLVPLHNVNSWNEFKAFVLGLGEPYRFAFRGQGDNTWRLRTAFHRTGRASLLRFMSQDIPALYRHLSGLTTHHFDLSNALDYAAFLNLAQHHGYPTPILDRTWSPFVAAYFAFRHVRKSDMTEDRRVRVLILDAKQWNIDFQRAEVPMPGFLHMTVLEPLATDNPRAIPQQSISTITNIDDLEHYISTRATAARKTYLSAIDIPASERRTVMQELALMGITAGSLFPGLEGACLQLKERFFDL